MCNQIILLPPSNFLASRLCNMVNKDLCLCLASAFAINPPNDFNEAVATVIAMEANLQAIQLAHSLPPLPSTTSFPPFKPTSSTSGDLLLLFALCDDIDSYYEYCHAINELVEDSLDHDPYG
ncbi:hypothetical protein QOT17_024812 [Balamuthia mandrillaris]